MDVLIPIDPRWLKSGAGVRLFVNGSAVADRFEAFCDNAGRIVLHGLRGEFVISRAAIVGTRARINDRLHVELE